ncbi:MAG: hypothetical protein QGI09_01510 [Dehalococcoidia bacterium]|jgi:hypothetical protein|nr:hypothetical protein [Dehalococcoidia bacterium]
MTSYSTNENSLDVSELFAPQLEGQLRLRSAFYMRLQYPGEVIVASQWDDAWSQDLTHKVIKIVRMTDLSPLSNAMSPQVLAFLGASLGDR